MQARTRSTLSLVLAVALLTMGAGGAQAALIRAYTGTNATPANNANPLAIGNQFSVTGGGITVFDLGVYASGPGNVLVNAHDLTLFEVTAGAGNSSPTTTPLMTINIPAGTGTLDNVFRFQSITPTYLPAGNYALIAYGLGGAGDFYGTGSSPSASFGGGDAGHLITNYEYGQTSPNYPIGPFDTFDAYVVVSFHFENGNTVPEPAGLCVIAAGGLLLLRRRGAGTC